MRKIIGFIFAFFALVILFTACGGDTLADKMANERKAINRFIDSEGIIVTNKFPADTIFPPKVYYKDPDTGIYIRVISKGTGEKASTTKKTLVYARYDDLRYVGSSDTTKQSIIGQDNGTRYMQFKYGESDTYTATSSSYLEYYNLSAGCVLPLKYVANGGEVSLIIPYASGSTYQKAYYQPYYYGLLRYTY